jgi:transposase
MVEFADRHQLSIRLVYYPPYHSKYNPIERCWGILEMHWNGTLLSTIEKALKWAETMTWKGLHPDSEFAGQNLRERSHTQQEGNEALRTTT